MSQAGPGDRVSIHYTGRLDDGTVFDTSREQDPIQFVLGEGGIIQGFQEAVHGMAVGEVKTAAVPPEKAYGERRDDLVITVPSEKLPENFEPEVGGRLEMGTSDGQRIPVVVTAVRDGGVEIDANHPLAGQQLTFEIELVEVG